MSASINLQTSNVFMPSSSNKNANVPTLKNNATMGSADIGVNMKNMYKQLASGGGVGLVENKNYLNSHIQPSTQLQATKIMNTGGNSLNQTT